MKVYDGPKIILPEKNTKNKKLKNEIINNIDNQELKIENNDEINHENNDENNDVEKKIKSSSLKYADKKRLAIEHALYYLKKDQNNYVDFFNNHKKKDDLADSFLQGLYYLNK